jgi:phage-related protein (TIGR01555 family)
MNTREVQSDGSSPSKTSLETKLDGWENVVTGLSSSYDKLTHTHSKMGVILPDSELESIFVDDGLGTRIIKLLPDDMFREGWDYDFPEMEEREAKENAEAYKEAMEFIKALAKIKEGFYWSRLYGGAVILIGALDGQSLDKPLKPSRIRSFEYLKVIRPADIDFSKIRFQFDPEQPRYGMPEYYPISFVNHFGVIDEREVHYSRIIELHGNRVPDGARTSLLSQEQRYWGLSVLQNVDEYLRIVGTSVGSIGHLLNEFSVGKYKLADLDEILNLPDGEERIKKRMRAMDFLRSVYHSMFFGSGDDFIREDVTFTGIPEVLYNIFMLVSACTGYPITRLFGVSPAGLNSTGESDMNNYYDAVRSLQVSDAEPIILRLVRIISEWKGIEEPYIKWRPLKQLSEKEQAEVDKLKADTESVKASTYQTYISAGIMEPYQAQFLEFGDTLDKIPVPEDLLPPVETIPEGEGNKGKEGIEGEDENKGADPDQPDDDTGNNNGGKNGSKDKPGDPEAIETRIAELEEKDELTEEEQKELDELKKQLEQSKAGKSIEGGKK